MALQHQILNDAERLLKDTGRAPDLPGMPALRHRLNRILERYDGKELERPATVALIGGTGVGKSELFNKLSGIPGASPPSEDVRGHTQRLHVAVSHQEEGLLRFPPQANPAYHHTAAQGLALIDAPDLDSAIESNHGLARHALAAADLVVYMAIPDNRASFVINREILDWADRKRWFFVLNKIDYLRPEEVEKVRRDFKERIREMGFEADEDTLFLISARNPDHNYSEFERLRTAIFSSRPREQTRALRLTGMLGEVAWSTELDELKEAEALVERLKAEEVKIEASIRTIFERTLSSSKVGSSLQQLVREEVWRQMPGRAGFFLALPIWIRQRLSNLWLAWNLSRMATGAASVAGLAQSAWFSLQSYLQGRVPLENILARFPKEDVRDLRAIGNDVRRVLEDLGVDHYAQDEDTEEEPPDLETSEAAEKLHPMLGQLTKAVFGDKIKKDDPTAQIIPPLVQAIETTASRSVDRAVGWAHVFFGNLLPAVVTMQIAYRVVVHWTGSLPMPDGFYLHALTVYFFSLLPGYLLVSKGVSSRAARPKTSEVLENFEEAEQAAPLRRVRLRVEGLLRQVRNLHRAALRQRDAINTELSPERFGATQRKTRESQDPGARVTRREVST